MSKRRTTVKDLLVLNVSLSPHRFETYLNKALEVVRKEAKEWRLVQILRFGMQGKAVFEIEKQITEENEG